MAESSSEVLNIKVTPVSASFMFYADLDLFVFAILFLLLMLCSKSSKLTNTFVRSYLAPYMLILLTKAIALITLALLTCPKQRCQTLIFWFLLTRCISWLYPLNVIDWYVYFGVLSALLTFITFLRMAKSRMKKFWLFLICVIVFSSFINAMLVKLL